MLNIRVITIESCDDNVFIFAVLEDVEMYQPWKEDNKTYAS